MDSEYEDSNLSLGVIKDQMLFICNIKLHFKRLTEQFHIGYHYTVIDRKTDLCLNLFVFLFQNIVKPWTNLFNFYILNLHLSFTFLLKL